jgi:hypothetical protein
MTDEGPQQPPRGRRARGSVDPGPGYPGDLPRYPYPSSQYPEIVPGQRRRAAAGDSQAAEDYPGPPGSRGRLAGDASGGNGRAAPPGASTPGRPGETAGGYGRAGVPGDGPGYAGPAAPGGIAPGQEQDTDPGAGSRSYPAAPPRGPYEPRRGRRAAARREEPGGTGDFYADRGPRSDERPAPGQAPEGGRQGRGDSPGREAAGTKAPGQATAGHLAGAAAPPARNGYLGRTDFLDRGPDDDAGDSHSGGRGRGLFGRRSREADPEPDDDAGGRTARAGTLAPPGRGTRAARPAPAVPAAPPGESASPGRPAPRGGPVPSDGSIPRGFPVGAGGPVPSGGPGSRGDSVPGGRSIPPGGPLAGDGSIPPGRPLPGGRPVPPGGPGMDGYLTAPPRQALLEGAPSGQAGQATGEPAVADWTSAPRRGRRHRPEPPPEVTLAPAVGDRPERAGPSRHGRAPGGSGVGWDSAPDAGPGQAPATGPAGGARAASGRTASGWAGSGPNPPGRRSPEPAGRGRGGTAGFVADPEFDLDDGRAQEREPAHRPVSRPSAIQPPADPRAADGADTGRRARGRAAVREAPAERAVRPDDVAPAGGERPLRAARSGRRSGRRRSRRILMIGAGLAVVLAGAAAAAESGLFGGGPGHVLVTPDKLGSYVRRPQLEKQMNASQLQREVITKSAGQASHVVSAVYEDGTNAASTKTPQMILFIGGNLSGVSPGGFIASFTQQSKGAFETSAGSLGGSVACVNAQASVPGSVALCTWADNDTFGVVASPTMSATRLAAQLRAIRPMVEHVAK